MLLRQLRYVVAIHRCGNHISAAANALHTSQPGLSKQIQLLEHELGFAIFERKRNRLVGLTEPGQKVVEIAQHILGDVQNLRTIKDDHFAEEYGSLVIGTTQTSARYILPPIISGFMVRYPKVHLRLQQGNPTQICEAVEEGKADIAIGTDTMRPFPRLVRFPCFPVERSLIARKDHPILRVKNLTLEEIVKYPMVAHDPYRSGSWKILDAFRAKGLEPNVVLDAVDADVAKTYVELGLGIAVLAAVAVDPKHDRDLRARDASHLFEASMTYISLRKGAYVRRYVFDFIQALAPKLLPEEIRTALRDDSGAP
ncbi:LysR substrate-binding domain-containing protein [Acidisphaera sp. S103]|uniref:LysR substrate-binding domain-containing protein n=1 Tax=Acidisphaera sp. S103 TaxID=1747223 RepID=UPI00131CD6E4|nr:LysR substrate-binding domain-containing protein [Acidisphaera sp. S103]